MEMRGKHATLVRPRRSHVEVYSTMRRVRVLHETSVDDAPAGRIHQVTSTVLDEEALSDTFVDHDEGDLRHGTGSVVNFSESLTELGKLFVDDLIAHSISNSVSEDDIVSG